MTRTPLSRPIKVKGQLVADVLNNQHAGTGATWRINANILSACRGGGKSPRAQLVDIQTFYRAPACMQSATLLDQFCLTARPSVCLSASPSVRLSVQYQFCVEMKGHVVTFLTFRLGIAHESKQTGRQNTGKE